MNYYFDLGETAALDATADVLFNKIRNGEIDANQFREEFYKFGVAQWEQGEEYSNDLHDDTRGMGIAGYQS